MFKRFGLLLLGAYTSCMALSLDDFVPDFLTSSPKTESSVNSEIAFSIPESSKKRNASSNSAWYCDRVHNVFCSKQDASKVIALAVESSISNSAANINPDANPNGKYFNRNSNNYDQNAINNFNLTNSNQSALQTYSPKLNNQSAEDQIRNNVAVPIQADKNTNISVGQQQIEFNIKY